MTENNSPDDDILDSYLDGNSGLSDRYRKAASEMPPQSMDRAILSASRKAVGARKHIAFSPFSSDWHIPFSLAAVLVLSVALVVIIRNESSLPSLEEPLQQDRQLVPENGGAMMAKKASPEDRSAVVTEQSTPASKATPAPAVMEKHEGEPVFEAGSSTARNPPAGTAATDENKAAADSPASGSLSREQKSSVQTTGMPQLFLENLLGTWSGTAITTPLGPVAYDIAFRPAADNCISGTAHPGTNHTWTFCPADEGLALDFLTDFRGNRTPIHFRQLAYNDGVYTFKAATHEFMEVLVFAGKTSAWMKIFHYGKLHVEIQLKRK